MNTLNIKIKLPIWCVSPESIVVMADNLNKAVWTKAHYFFNLPGGEIFEMFLNSSKEVKTVQKFSKKGSFKHNEQVRWLDVPEIFRIALLKELSIRGEGGVTIGDETYFVHFGDPVTIYALLHLVHSREITLQLMMKLDFFQEVRFVREIHRELNGFYYVDEQYVIDDEHFVTVTEKSSEAHNSVRYKIELYKDVKHIEDCFGQRAAHLAETMGIPWDIALFVCHHSSDEVAMELLSTLKKARGKADMEMKENMLNGGLNSRMEAIEKFLGISTYRQLNFGGPREIQTLANFLAATY